MIQHNVQEKILEHGRNVLIMIGILVDLTLN